MARQSTLNSRSIHRRRAAAVILVTAAAAIAAPTATALTQPTQPRESDSLADASATAAGGLLFETFAPDGSITLKPGSPDRASTALPLPAHLRAGNDGVKIIPMHVNGPSANRIDLVFIGDGYTASEQPIFAKSAEAAWKALMSVEPYKTYQNFFNAELIEVNSPVSGITADPTPDVKRATPLGMHFYCHGIDRLLCVDTKAAAAYANLVAGRNYVVSIAHTTTYGGAGGSITTLAGENPASDQVIVHEMAHTLAGLGDEYDVPYSTASGSAGTLVNASEKTQEQMVANKWKWYQWIGRPSPDGGTVGAYEGANYYKKGYYRPSVNSIMRTLGQPFNPPSAEAMVKAFYANPNGQGNIDPIDSATPVPNDAVGVPDPNTTLSVGTIPLVGQSYLTYWAINGAAVDGTIGQTSFNPAKPPPAARQKLNKGAWNQVTVYVRDQNPAVIDTAFQSANMNKTRRWWVWGG